MIYEGKKNTDKWFPISLVDGVNLNVAKTTIAFAIVTCKYGYEGAASQSTYSVTTNDWKEQGAGDYWLSIGQSEFTSEGKYRVRLSATGCADCVFDVEVRDRIISEIDDEIIKIPKSDSNVTFNATALASINTEADTALSDINLDHLIKLAKDTSWAATVTKESIIDLLTSKNTSQTFDRATASLEANLDNVGAAGAGLTSLGDTRLANLDAAVSSRTKPADTQAAVTTVATVSNAVTTTSDTKITSILEDTGTTLDTLIKDVPTVTEFEARSLPSADYVVVGDTIAKVTDVVNTVNAQVKGIDTDAITAASLKTDAVTEIVDAIVTTGIIGGGKWVNEGETDIGNMCLKNATQGDKYLGLYKDTYEPPETATLATITEVAVAFGYARIKLENADWTEDATVKGQFTNIVKTFTASGGSFGTVTGYFICTSASGTSGKLWTVEHFNTPHVITNGLSEQITPTLIIG